jgi:hypothetical protein
MSQATWQFSAFDPNTGKTIDFLDCPSQAQYTRRLDDYCDFHATITQPQDFFAIQPYSSGIQCLRNGIPRFRGRIVDPFERTPRTRTIMAKDPFHNLYWRRVRKHIKYTDAPDEIAWNLIHLQNTYKDIGLRSGADAAWGDHVTRRFKAGDVVADEVKAMALTHGEHYHFRINARYDEDDVRAMAAIQTFSTVHTKSGARFEFGGSTLENIEDYSIEYGQPINRATVIGERRFSREAIGKSTGDTGNCAVGVAKSTPSKNPPVTESYTAGDSEHDYGLWEEEFGGVNKPTSLAHLQAVAKTNLKPKPPRTITITPNDEAPRLFDDFDVGDKVYVRIHDYDFTLTAWCTVWEVVVDIDEDSGQESISSMSFINPQDTSA